MNHQEIKEQISSNIEQANLNVDELRVQPDPFIGWRIIVISSGFEGKDNSQRKQIVLAGLQDLTIEWLELLTPVERQWAGDLPIDSTLEELPLWPEALARAKTQPQVVFPSDLDEDLETPIVTTFYSLRGGVGRSTALAYTARILASKGYTILCVDMDLEAPGLAALFGKEEEIGPEQGLLHILLALDQGENPAILPHILRISETDELYCLPAGIPDANYARLLRFIDTEAWYREESNPLRQLITILSEKLPFKPDVILLDARTGITPLNGPLLFDLSDLAVIVFFPHPQAKKGTGELVRALLSASTRREQRFTPEPRFLVSPIPASKAPEVIQRYQHRALEWIADWLSLIKDNQIIIEADLTHFIPYREAIATSDRIMEGQDVWQDFEVVATWLEGFLPTLREEALEAISLVDSKAQILEELEFSAGMAEYQQDFLENFVETPLIHRALHPVTHLVRGRKGTGKTAIFRRLLEDEQKPSVVVMSPTTLKGNPPWILSPDGFKDIEDSLQANKTGWREFWTLQTCLACYLSHPEKPQPEAKIAELLTDELDSELKVVRCLQKLLDVPNIGLLARDWLKRLDKATQLNTFLLLDGLDSGFGNSPAERDRRKEAIRGLLSLITDIADQLQNLHFKLLLREDIWSKLEFKNKSHFYGRSVTLAWSDQAKFFQVVLKQAMKSNTFQNLVKSLAIRNNFPIILGDPRSRVGNRLATSEDFYTGSEVFPVFDLWNLLVGERMRGGKSAFTRNWVWKRLADGNNNRSPRHLLQLFNSALVWEKKEQQKNPYNRTIIRPRALISCLEEVSHEALNALVQEDFPELQGLIDQLKELGRSPFKATELLGLDEELSLAREVGLIAIYEGTEEDIQRYQVPDIYRLGMSMTRKGQT